MGTIENLLLLEIKAAADFLQSEIRGKVEANVAVVKFLLSSRQIVKADPSLSLEAAEHLIDQWAKESGHG